MIASSLKTKEAPYQEAFVQHCETSPFVDGAIPWRCTPMQHEPFRADRGFDAELPSVTVVCPTYGGRHGFHGLLNYTFFSQSYPESKLDLLVLDDNSTGDSPLAQYWRSQSRVKYVRLEGVHTIGWKRNWLLGRAKGDMIVNFDDDDFYNHFYVRYMAEYLHNQRDSQVKLVQIASWVNVYPTPDHWGHVNEKRTFEAQCTEWPSVPMAFAWIYHRSVVSKCGFQTVNYGEETDFLECIHNTFGPRSMHRIGDANSQLIKVDTCGGSTSAGAFLRDPRRDKKFVTKDNMIAMYGHNAWSALHNLSLAHVDLAKCVRRQVVQRHKCT